MPIFERSATPDYTGLMYNHLGQEPSGFDLILAGQLKFWIDRQDAAENVGDLGMHALANAIGSNLAQAASNYMRKGEVTPALVEQNRVHAIGAVGMSLMGRAMVLHPDFQPHDVRATSITANVVTDIYDDVDGVPFAQRMHMSPEAADAFFAPTDQPEQWYRRGSLFVRRTVPAQPSATLVTALEMHGDYGANIQSMVTVFPTLVA